MENKKKIEEYIQILRDNKIRVTDQRVAILNYMIEKESHPTAREIYEALKDDYPSMSVATIYNNLEIFVALGFVLDLHYGAESARFDLTDCMHYHAICEKCGRIVDFNYPKLNQVEHDVAELTGFEVRSHRLEIFGVCPACQKNK
nr:Fur family transcriptional regulator [Allofustis seminis]